MKQINYLVLALFLLALIVVIPSLLQNYEYLIKSYSDVNKAYFFPQKVDKVIVFDDEDFRDTSASANIKAATTERADNKNETKSLRQLEPIKETQSISSDPIKCSHMSNATAMQQEIRELKGEIASLKGSSQAKIQNTVKTEAEMWADFTQILQRDKVNCVGPRKSEKDKEDPLWDILRKNSKSGKVCGCLIPFSPRKYSPDTCKTKKMSSELPKELLNCPLLWIMTIGDSTMLQWNSWLLSIIIAAGYVEQRWRPSQSDDDEIKISMTKLRQTLSQSGRLGVHLNYEDDYLFVHPETNYAILLSARTAMGMSLSKWMTTIKEPLKQIQVPHLPGGGSIVQHPSLDEPYYIDAGSQILDYLHHFCKKDFNYLIEQLSQNRKPDLIVGGSALWDTGGDSNMQHRNEVHRCGMKLPVLKSIKNDNGNEESIILTLYRRRLTILFNFVCERLGNSLFTWRTSGLGSRIIVKDNKETILPDDIVNYAETASLNEVARSLAAEFGIEIFDYEKVHKKYSYRGVDGVHPVRDVVLEGTHLYLKQALEKGKNSGSLSPLQQKILSELVTLSTNGTELTMLVKKMREKV